MKAPKSAPRWDLNWYQTSTHWLRAGRSMCVASAMRGSTVTGGGVSGASESGPPVNGMS